MKVGEPIKITCTSIGSPPPVLQWGFKTQQGALREEADQDDGVLNIPSAQMSDAGEYFCMASNDHGTVFERATVTVDSGTTHDLSFDLKITTFQKMICRIRSTYCESHSQNEIVETWRRFCV